MKLKTFLAGYLLFLGLLFSSLGFVSSYMTTNQMDILRRQSQRDFGRISASLARDIAALQGGVFPMEGAGFNASVDTLVRGYSHYYQGHGISLALGEAAPYSTLQFTTYGHRHYIYIVAPLPGVFQHMGLTFRQCVTDSVAALENIQRILLTVAIAFAMIAAFAFYFALSYIFKPLDIVAGASIDIANGNYGKRIFVRGKGELSQVARDFNRMAVVIENQIRQLEAEADQKQQFIDNFAHEIRTPLTSIYGNAEYLQKAPYNEGEMIELTGTMMERTNHMIQIANSLLQLATLRDYAPTKCLLPLPPLLDNITETLRLPLAAQGTTLTWQADTPTVLAQEDLLKSLLLNLCHNAIKACPKGRGTITIAAHAQEGNTILKIQDNGYGIPKESLPRITEPFYRVDSARDRSQGGVGLGMALCQQIAKAHGGSITIQSDEGVGTEVAIVLPEGFTKP